MADLYMRILIDARNTASSVIKSVGGELSRLGAVSGKMAPIRDAALLAGTAVLGFGVALSVVSTQKAAEFQQAMLLNVSHAGLLKSKMDETGRAILQMSTEVGRSPVEMAQALYPILSGFSGIQDQSAKTAISLATLKLSFQAVAGSEASGVDVAHSAIAAFNAFGMQTNNQATNLKRMQTLFDQMNETVKTGNMKWAEYSRTIGIFAANMAQTHIKFAEGNAALAVFTNTGERTQLAATHLSSLFQKMSFDTDSLATHAKKLHLSFNETAFKSMNLADKIKYLDEITGHDTGKVKAILGNKTLAATFTKLRDHMNDYKSALGAISHSHGSLASSFQTASSGATAAWGRIKASLDVLFITIGSQLLPVLTNLMNKVAPLIAQFANWLVQSGALKNAINFVVGAITNLVNWGGQVVSFFQQNHAALAALLIILGAVAGLIAGLVVAAFVAWAVAAWGAAVAVLAATWPFLLIGAIIGAVVVGIVLAVQHWGQIAHWLQGIWGAVIGWLRGVWSGFSGWLLGLLGKIGGFFTSVWNGIVSGVRAAWNWIVTAAKIGALLLLAVIFAPIIAIVALFLWLYNHNYYFKALIDTIVNVVKAGLAWLQSAWTNVVNFLVGLWNGIRATAATVWNAITSAIQAALSAVQSVMESVWNAIVSFLSGIWQTISTDASNLWNTIVGFFQSAWGRISGPLNTIGSNIGTFFGNLASTALNWGKNLIQGFINGIQGMLGAVGNAAQNVVSTVAKFLGFHSPTREGPGREIDVWGPNMVKSFSAGMLSAIPRLQSSLNLVMQPVAQTMMTAPVAHTMSSPGSGARGGTTIIHNHNHNISVNAPALSRREAQNLAEVLDKELGHRYRSQYSSASTGSI